MAGAGSKIGNFLKPSLERVKKIPKWAGIGGAIGAGAVALPILAYQVRESRRVEGSEPPMAPELTAPIPQVMEFAPPPVVAQNTLMGEIPVEGDQAKRIKAQRGGQQGLDTATPNILRADGTNAIDGARTIQDLNAPGGMIR